MMLLLVIAVHHMMLYVVTINSSVGVNKAVTLQLYVCQVGENHHVSTNYIFANISNCDSSLLFL